MTVESCSRAALPSAKDFFAYAAVSVAMAAKVFEAVACVVRTRSTLDGLNFCIVDIGAQERELSLLEDPGEGLAAEVELVIAQGHGVIAQAVHDRHHRVGL